MWGDVSKTKHMCAINGFTTENREQIEGMNEISKHRGPDGSGVFLSEGVSLGHNRLAILDTSEAAAQPMSTRDGRYTITYNGEIYNFKELREKLVARGYKFTSTGDTEVILNYFVEFGIEGLSHLNGIFAFAVWDCLEKKLYVVRDPFGVKPLFYRVHHGVFIFSSEVRALKSFGDKPGLNTPMVNNFFRFQYVLGPQTMWDGIFTVPAGQVIVVDEGGLSTISYYTPPTISVLKNVRDAREELRNYMRASVRRQLISDRPVGIFLSGGIDSSVIASLVAQETDHSTHSFSVGFETDFEKEKYNVDAITARATAASLGFIHHEIMMTGRDMAEHFETVINAMEVPVANHIEVATWMLAREAKKEVAVVLGGDGGDEVFGGYDRYYYYRLFERVHRVMPWLKSPLGEKLLKKLGTRVGFAEKLRAESQFEVWMSFMSQKEKQVARVLTPEANNPFIPLASYRRFFDTESNDLARHMMTVDRATWLIDESLIRSDKLTMAHGVEQRVPFLDHELVAFAHTLSTDWLLDSSKIGKKILRDAFADVLPTSVRTAKKRGFFSPAAKWLRTDMKSLAYEILSPSYCEQTRHLFNWDEIAKILDDHIEKRHYGLTPIWSLMTFQVWARNNL